MRNMRFASRFLECDWVLLYSSFVRSSKRRDIKVIGIKMSPDREVNRSSEC